MALVWTAGAFYFAWPGSIFDKLVCGLSQQPMVLTRKAKAATCKEHSG